MKDIVVLSGKGGVGKSAIAASLGAILSKDYKLIMADTDGDEPNLELFFDARRRELLLCAISTFPQFEF